MFRFPRKNNKIEFYTAFNTLLEIEDVLPSTGASILKTVMKKVKVAVDSRPTNDKSTSARRAKGGDIRQCPGIVQYMKRGYIIKAWHDIHIKTDESGDSFTWESSTSRYEILTNHQYEKNSNVDSDVISAQVEKEASSFSQNIFFDFFPRKNTLKQVIKINTPWFVKLPKGYGALILPIFYDNEERFTTIPGIIPTDYLEKLNVQLYWHNLGSENSSVIKAGTPLAKIIPIKLEDWDLEVREINLNDTKKLNVFRLAHDMTFARTWNACTNYMDGFLNKK
jgi:hypothetical protein